MTAPLPHVIPLLTEEEVRRASTHEGDESGYGCLRGPAGALPLREMNVEARIIATFAHTTVRQVFHNDTGAPLEATYIFPLPDRAAVTRFSMEVAGRVVEGVLEERMQARRTYDQAVAQGKRASIAEEERAGVFTIRVGNLMPGERAAVTLEMSGPLPVTDGEVTYRFPLVVAPRYMPGQLLGGENVGDGVAGDTDAVPDASRISPPVLLPGLSSPVRLSMSVELDPAGLPMSQVRSSLHAAYADERGGRLVVRTTPGERLNRDFILRFVLGDASVRSSARLLRDGASSVFALTLLPPSTASAHAKPKDVVFVLDRSGSMQGWKMVAARRATARMIDALRPQDRFHVLAFDNRVEAAPLGDDRGLHEASDRHRYQATEWLAKLDARGGTEMAAPLHLATRLFQTGTLDRDRVLVFVTDGQVGNEAQLMQVLGDGLRGARVFALGIDQAVNGAFLNRLAQLGRSGEAELVESEDRLDEVLVRVHRKVDTPVIAEVSVDVVGASLVPGALAPAQMPDVFPGVPATIFGKVEGGAPTFVVRGRLADGSRFEERVAADEVTNPAVRTAWARFHLRDLEDRFDAGRGNKGELERRIVDVSRQNRVLCRFTAFVAVDGEVVNRGGWQHKAVQPVEAPAGWSGAAAAPAPARRMAARGRPPAMPAGGRDLDGEDALFEAGPTTSVSAKPDVGPAAPPPPAAESRAGPAARQAPAKKEMATRDAAPTRAGGILGGVAGAVGNLLGGGGRRVRLDAFRARIVELVELARTKASDVAGVARELERRLRLLLEDIAHAGVDADARRPLDEAYAKLRDAVAAGDVVAMARTVDDAERALDAAAGGVPVAAPTRREGFWR